MTHDELIERTTDAGARFGRLRLSDISTAEVLAHVKFLRAETGASSGYTADLLEAVALHRDALRARSRSSGREG